MASIVICFPLWRSIIRPADVHEGPNAKKSSNKTFSTSVEVVKTNGPYSNVTAHIMLRDELTQKSMKVKMVFGFGYPRACRFRKLNR
jgi:hypothetical protein